MITQEQADRVLDLYEDAVMKREVHLSLKKEFYEKYTPGDSAGLTLWGLVHRSEKRYLAAQKVYEDALSEHNSH